MLAHTKNTDFKALIESHLHEFREYIEPKLNNLNHDVGELPAFLDNFGDII